MISESLPHKEMKMHNATEPAIESTYRKKIIKPIRKYEMQLEKHELDGYFIKRVDARRLRFQFDDLRNSSQTIKTLSRVIRSSKKTRKVEVNNSEFSDLTSRDKSLISESLKRLSCLQDIRLNFGGYQGQEESPELRPLSHGLRTLRGLRSMNLGFALMNEVSKKEMNRFGRVLKSLVPLQKVDFKFDGWNHIDETSLLKVGQALIRLNYLQEISLSFEECRDIALKEFAEELQKMNHLTSLNFSFKHSSWMIDRQLKKLKKRVRALTSLTHFSLNCENSGVTDEGLQSLAETVKELIALESIKLNFKECLGIRHDGLRELSRSLQALSSLKVLSWGFGHSSSQLTDIGVKGGIESLGQSLQRLVSLETVQLNFEKYIGLSELETLRDSLMTLVWLKNLSLNFQGCRGNGRGIADQALSVLGQTLQGLVSLESFNLKFEDWVGINDYGLAGLNSFGSGLENLTSLRRLSLSLRGCRANMSAGFKTVCLALKKFELLESLELNFSTGKYFENDGFNQLSQSLKSLSRLQNISLHFAECSEIHDSDLQVVIQAFQKLPFVQSINLDFRYGWLLTDEVLEKMIKVLRTFRSLHSVTLNFTECDEMTQAGKDCFEKEFKSLGFIKNKEIKF